MGNRSVKEDVRHCKVCGNEWRAVRVTAQDAKQPPMIGRGFGKRQQDLAIQTMHEKKIRDHERWAICSICGSQNVVNIKASKAKPVRSRRPLPVPQPKLRPSKAVTPPVPPPAWPAPPPVSPPVWSADPFGRYEHRYWDGQAWTEHVSRAGIVTTDPPDA